MCRDHILNMREVHMVSLLKLIQIYIYGNTSPLLRVLGSKATIANINLFFACFLKEIYIYFHIKFYYTPVFVTNGFNHAII